MFEKILPILYAIVAGIFICLYSKNIWLALSVICGLISLSASIIHLAIEIEKAIRGIIDKL